MSIPFWLAGGAQPLILIEAFVNARGPFHFVLDTGAGLCLVTPAVASDAGIVATAERTGIGAAGTVSLRLGVAESLAVGDANVSGLRIGVTDELGRIGNAVGAAIDGAIGYEFLRDYCVTLDYAERTMSLSGASKATDAASEPSPVRFRLAHPAKPLILIDAFVNESGPFSFALDTGASATTISPDLASTLRLTTTPIPSITGGGGAIAASATRLRSLRVGPRSVSEVDVAVTGALDRIAGAIGQKLDGILGFNFLKHYRVVLDYPNESLLLADSRSRDLS